MIFEKLLKFTLQYMLVNNSPSCIVQVLVNQCANKIPSTFWCICLVWTPINRYPSKKLWDFDGGYFYMTAKLRHHQLYSQAFLGLLSEYQNIRLLWWILTCHIGYCFLRILDHSYHIDISLLHDVSKIACYFEQPCRIRKTWKYFEIDITD